jgi:hypothetical protein
MFKNRRCPKCVTESSCLEYLATTTLANLYLHAWIVMTRSGVQEANAGIHVLELSTFAFGVTSDPKSAADTQKEYMRNRRSSVLGRTLYELILGQQCRGVIRLPDLACRIASALFPHSLLI